MGPILALFLILSLFCIAFLYYRYNQANARIRRLDDDRKIFESQAHETIQRWQGYANGLKAENESLAKWKVVEDADKKAAEILDRARAGLEKAKAEAARVLSEAQRNAQGILAAANDRSLRTTEQGKLEAQQLRNEAEAVLVTARDQAKEVKKQAQLALDAATHQSSQIIEQANVRAQEIAGSAFDAKNKADLYERTARAMKNIIDGYGDQYLRVQFCYYRDHAALHSAL
jgi:vacuolar-type H+-ATPase subunit E/Vma4